MTIRTDAYIGTFNYRSRIGKADIAALRGQVKIDNKINGTRNYVKLQGRAPNRYAICKDYYADKYNSTYSPRRIKHHVGQSIPLQFAHSVDAYMYTY